MDIISLNEARPKYTGSYFKKKCVYVFLEFCIIYKRPTIVNFEWLRKQIQIMIYKLFA